MLYVHENSATTRHSLAHLANASISHVAKPGEGPVNSQRSKKNIKK